MRALGVASAIAGAVLATAAPAQQVNPYDGDARAIRAGTVLYQSRCAECHGPEAKGVLGPDLTGLWAAGRSDERVFQTIRNGLPGSVMPPSKALDPEIWAVVAYLKSLGTVPPWEPRGDAANGRRIFAASCARCHVVDGDGGRLGPDLTRIAQNRPRDAVIHSIRNPDAAVPVGYRTVALVTPSGETVRGAIKNEDAFSIQIMDTDERLRGYLKSDLRRITREPGSLMPAFGADGLGDEALDDLLRYLATL